MIGKHLEPFKFWCQKVLPNVYDDSLSYYEYLCKLNNYLNDVIEQINTLTDNMSDYETDLTTQWTTYRDELSGQWQTYKTYIDTYFDNLDVQQEINNKLDTMASDGTLSALIEPFIGNDIQSSITAWLRENVDPVGSAVIVDKTLTIDGAAADAKVVGDDVTDIKTIIDNLSYYINFTDESLYHTGYPTIENGTITYGSEAYWRSIIVESNGNFFADVTPSSHFIYLNASTEVVLDKVTGNENVNKLFCPPVSGATRVLVLTNPSSGPNVYRITPLLNINNKYSIIIKQLNRIEENYGYGNSVKIYSNDTTNPAFSIYDWESRSEHNITFTNTELTISHNTNLLINTSNYTLETSSSNVGDDTHIFLFRNYMGIMQNGLALWFRGFKYYNNITSINNSLTKQSNSINELYSNMDDISYYQNFTNTSLYHTGYPTFENGTITYGSQTYWRSIIVEENGDFYVDVTPNSHFFYLNNSNEVVLDRNIGSESINKLYCPPVSGATRVLVMTNPSVGPNVYHRSVMLPINNRYSVIMKFMEDIVENYGYGNSLKLVCLNTETQAFSVYDWITKQERNITFATKEVTVPHNTNLLINTTNNTLETSASNLGDDTHIFLFRNYLGMMQNGLALWFRGFKYYNNIKSINTDISNINEQIVDKVNVNNNSVGKYIGNPITFNNFYKSRYIMYPTDTNGNLVTYLQDGAVYKNYLFQFNNKADDHNMYIYDLQTEKCIYKLNLTTTLSQPNAYHNGVISFTNEWYDPSDEFPLIALTESEFDSDSGAYDPTKSGYLLIYRITHANDEFGLTLVQTITMPKYEDTESKISAVFCDYQSSTMWLIAVCNSGTYEGNPKVRYWKFQKKALSYGDYTIDLTDALAYFDVAWSFTWQTACAYEDKIYQLVNFTENSVYHIELSVYNSSGTLLSKVVLNDLEMFSKFVTNEPEQLSIYNDSIFVTCRYGIYKLNF